MLENALKTLTLTANSIIKNKFNLDVELKVKYEKATFNNLVNNIGKQRNQKLRNPRIILNAIMTHPQIIDNTPIEHPRSFFNEAKLTQMALSLRLAVLDFKPALGEKNNSTVFIDDLLISLDMACRRKVISVILQ